jgi:hypothetical protein
VYACVKPQTTTLKSFIHLVCFKVDKILLYIPWFVCLFGLEIAISLQGLTYPTFSKHLGAFNA